MSYPIFWHFKLQWVQIQLRSNKNIFGKENAVWENRLLKAFQNLAWFFQRSHPLVSEIIRHAFV